jgi:hypothetical protein
MKFYFIISMMTVLIISSLLIFVHSVEHNTITVKYDCRQLIGGWHPDVPVAVQEACRSRRTNASSETRN